MKNEIAIISASNGFNKEIDRASNEQLVNQLTAKNFAFKEVLGRYKGMEETSFVVKVDTEAGMRKVLGIATEFNQTNIMYVKEDDTAYLVYCADGEAYNVGKFQEVEVDAVSELEGSTYDPTTGKHWSTV